MWNVSLHFPRAPALPAYKRNWWSLRKPQNSLSVTRSSDFQTGIFFCRNMVFLLLSWYNVAMIIKNERKHYASDLTDSQWAMIAPLFPPAGHKSKWEKRELVDAVLYLVENGCKWRNLPHDFPPYTTVSNFYHAAVKSGLWEKLLAALVAQTREQADKKAQPTYGIIDSQSVKTTGPAQERGIDGGKKRKDEKDTL